jgi:hypothetical protein
LRRICPGCFNQRQLSRRTEVDKTPRSGVKCNDLLGRPLDSLLLPTTPGLPTLSTAPTTTGPSGSRATCQGITMGTASSGTALGGNAPYCPLCLRCTSFIAPIYQTKAQESYHIRGSEYQRGRTSPGEYELIQQEAESPYYQQHESAQLDVSFHHLFSFTFSGSTGCGAYPRSCTSSTCVLCETLACSSLPCTALHQSVASLRPAQGGHRPPQGGLAKRGTAAKRGSRRSTMYLRYTPQDWIDILRRHGAARPGSRRRVMRRIPQSRERHTHETSTTQALD